MIRCYVTLCLRSRTVTSDELSDIMPIAPSRTATAGQLSALKNRIKHHGWFLSTRDMLDSGSLDDHINELFIILGNCQKAFEELWRLGVEITLACYFESNAGENPVITGVSLAKIAEIKVNEFWIDCQKAIH